MEDSGEKKSERWRGRKQKLTAAAFLLAAVFFIAYFNTFEHKINLRKNMLPEKFGESGVFVENGATTTLIGLWEAEEVYPYPKFMEFKEHEFCDSWSGITAEDFRCLKYEPYSLKENAIATKEGYLWMKFEVEGDILILTSFDADAKKEIYARSQKSAEKEDTASKEKLAPSTFANQSEQPQNLPEQSTVNPVKFASGSNLILFFRGVGIKVDAADHGVIYYNEKTGVLHQLSQYRTIDPNFVVSENSGEIFYARGEEIWKVDVNFNFLKRLTQGTKTSGLYPSPDGRYVAFAKIETEKPQGFDPEFGAYINAITTTVYTAKTDGSGLIKVKIPEGYESTVFINWFPDSKKLLVAGYTDKTPRRTYWEADPSSGAIKKFNRYGAIEHDYVPIPVFSPDNTKIATLEYYGGHEGRIWLMNMDGSERSAIFHGEDNLINITWSPDSQRFVVYQSGESILVFGRDGKLINKITSGLKDGNYLSIVWSKDSRFLFTDREDSSSTGIEVSPQKIIVFDMTDYSSMEFEVSGLKIPREEQTAEYVIASPSGSFYYQVIPRNYQETEKVDNSFPQLWRLNPYTGENKKISDNATLPFALIMP